jgi:hypothetical protein
MNGIIGILTGKGPACDELQAWLDTLQPYQPTQVLRIPGNQIAHQRNLVAQQMLVQDRPWVLFVDNDCIPPPGAIERLLSHDLPLVSGACVERVAPFDLCAIRSFEPFTRYRATDLKGQTEPFPVVAAGTGCLLVRREVFLALGAPWFRCGQLSADLLAEDTDFCLRAAEAGFPVYLDPLVKVGHDVRCVLYPGDEGLWAQWSGPFGLLPYREPLGDEVARVVHL